MWGNHSINCWRHLNHSLHRMKQVLAHLTKMQIDTGNSEPVSQRPLPITMKYYSCVRSEINKVLDAHIIYSSHSSWSAPIIVVPKGDGQKCLVIDYRVLKKSYAEICVTHAKGWRYLSKLNSAKCFSTLDLHAGYHHIPLNEDSITKTAFISPFGKYEYLKVPFGLAQAPVYFQVLRNKVLKDLPFAITYIDDIIIYSKTSEEHLDHLQQVFHKHCNAELPMKLSKCHFFAKEIQYLGHVPSTTGIKPLPSKTVAIKLMKPQKC